MTTRSPRYPTFPLSDAIENARKIHLQDRRYAIDREVAMTHMGYSPNSGTANKAMASLTQYGLLEKASKGQVQLSAAAENIILGDDPAAKKSALVKCAYAPALFSSLKNRFEDGVPSSEALRSHLIREGYTDAALAPAIKAYLDTIAYLKHENATESRGNDSEKHENVSPKPNEDEAEFGGAAVGDFIQWVIDGVWQLPKPSRVRALTEDSQWLFVEGSETGIPMEQVLVQETANVQASPAVTPPKLPLMANPLDEREVDGERVVYREEGEPGQYLKLVASGDLDDFLLEAVEDFVKRQRKRLGIAKPVNQ